jgi:hypothetical protein
MNLIPVLDRSAPQASLGNGLIPPFLVLFVRWSRNNGSLSGFYWGWDQGLMDRTYSS